jgi:hypothetical protein
MVLESVLKKTFFTQETFFVVVVVEYGLREHAKKTIFTQENFFLLDDNKG